MPGELEALKQECAKCNRCPLGATRLNPVFSDGNPKAEVMLIGEAPGATEDETGLPFVGQSGQLLDKILGSIGLSRKENVYICNTIKCRPPLNRAPFPSEKDACRHFLDRQIELVAPRVILLCGGTAAASMLPADTPGITKIRGKWFDAPPPAPAGAKMMPIFHPSYLLRSEARDEGSPRWLMWQDMKEIRKYLEGFGAAVP